MKILGALIVVAVFTVLGIIRANSLDRNARCLAEILESIRFISAELRSLATPLPEMFKEISKAVKPETKKFFCLLSDSMSEIEDTSFSALWEKSLKEGDLSLSHNEMIELNRLGKSLGRYSAEEQCTAIDVCISRLDSAYVVALNKALEGRKLYISLGLSTGIMFATLLI